MLLKKKSLLNTRLYLIVSITELSQDKTIYSRTQKALQSGVRLLQLRCKNIEDSDFLRIADKLNKLARKYKALFIINDRIDIAFCCDADGVHLGQEDLPLPVARQILGKDKIIGISAHNLKSALKAQKEKADYLGFGPVFKTKTKQVTKPIGSTAIKQLAGKIKIPFFAIGGINKNNIQEILSSGACRIAVSSAILSAKNIKRSVEGLNKFL